MSHLRDLQRLRNTKNNFQIKRNNNTPTVELKLNELKKPRVSHHNNEPIIVPDIIAPKVLEIDH